MTTGDEDLATLAAYEKDVNDYNCLRARQSRLGNCEVSLKPRSNNPKGEVVPYVEAPQ